MSSQRNIAARVVVTVVVTVVGVAVALAQERSGGSGGGIDPFRGAPAGRGGGRRPAATGALAGGTGIVAGPGGTIASVEFVDTPITNVFKMISDTTGWSIIMSPGVSGQKAPAINLFVKNIDPQELLDQVMLSANLVADRKDNIVHVMTFEEFARVRGVERRVVQLKHADASTVAAMLISFIDPTQSKVLPDVMGNRVVLLVPKPLGDSLGKLIEALDVPFAKDEVRIIKLKHLEAARIVPALEDFLTTNGNRSVAGGSRHPGGAVVPPSVPIAPPVQANPAGIAGAPGAAAAAAAATAVDEGRRAGEDWLVQFFVEPKLNVIVLRGLADDVQKTAELIDSLDIPPELKVVAYPLKFTNAVDAFDTLQQLVQDDVGGGGVGASRNGAGRRAGSSSGGAFGASGSHDETSRLRIAPSEQNNQIVVEGSADDHARMAQFIDAIDRPLPPGSGGIRVYKLENATSTEVADVLTSIVNDQVGQASHTTGDSRNARSGASGRTGLGSGGGSTGSLYGGSAGRRPGFRAITGGMAATGTGATGTGSGGASAQPSAAPAAASAGNGGDGGGGDRTMGGSADVIPPRITDAPEINAVVIRASASEQEELAAVVRELDRPRDQVVLEVTLVTVRSTDTFNLGVELAGGGNDLIGLSTFGVGSVDTTLGRVKLASPPPTGFNFGVIKAGDFTMVVNALKSVGDVRLSSTPKVLVQDNAPAQIRQVNREPYAVTSQGTNSTITSFGDYAEAGTTLTVTPHISRDQWLRLEYDVNLSSFDQRNAAQLAANLPPPTRQSESTGIVRIPSESMVVLGGLVSTSDENTVDKIPFVGDIPGLGLLFGQRTIGTSKETLFIFIRPTILRDLGFRDLRYLSEDDVRAARLSMQEYPVNPLKSLSPAWSVTGATGSAKPHAGEVR